MKHGMLWRGRHQQGTASGSPRVVVVKGCKRYFGVWNATTPEPTVCEAVGGPRGAE
ncbi:uncharacterized protein LACBIDRAFT_317668 [Laccaria bicolor S238N-H82]|uniref:Predicted protein n=1 Tax=Laccaria bicolor (strain S238N-H82 / ATCC MYA-4686) TaxID=486041 RepID=B0E260_LACBS|nr:uncharacterized protein LACBIDRAFT_317668 [Laccaria bicolor S238N-H82]EDQ99068.1 predicted protein [Laccaria bicolor S238N-H82]|eukprot:XP_001890270.1 predicted protein [Laccaria bicolor S238N-H82]